jgi:hypothetical protein
MKAFLFHKSTLATVAIVLCWGLFQTFNWASGAGKLEAFGPEAGDVLAAEIVLAVVPEKFHMIILQDMGRLGGVKGNSVFLHDISGANVQMLAREYWITEIKPWTQAAT